MLRAIQKYKRSIFGALIVAFVGVSMLGFGVNLFQSKSNQPYAVKVDDTRISFDQFSRQKRTMEQQYRQMFGKNYESAMKQLGLNISQTVADNIISDILMKKLVDEVGLVTSVADFNLAIRRNLFPDGFDAARYNEYLAQVGMTAPEFEKEIEAKLSEQQLSNLLIQVSAPSSEELKAKATRELSTFTADILTIDPVALTEKVTPRSDDELKAYYEANSTDFELPGQVAYDYLVLSEKQFPQLIEVSNDDVELYYADHQNKFRVPDEILARHIQVMFPKDATAEQKLDAQKRAAQILERAQNGEPFDKLAALYSDDYATKNNGGNLGWITRGKFTPEFEAELFKRQNAPPPELIELTYGFDIIKVDSYKGAATKPLDSVREEITNVLRAENAPAFLSAKAQELLDSWKKSDSSLSDFAVTKGFSARTSELLDENADPAPELKGLTQAIYTGKPETKQLVELGDSWVIAGVKEFKEPTIPSFTEVSQKILRKLREQDAVKTAEASAETLLAELKAKKQPTLRAAAEGLKLGVTEVADISRNSPNASIPDQKLLEAIVNTSTPLQTPTQAFKANGKMYVAQVTGIKLPAESAVAKVMPEKAKTAANEDGQLLLASILNEMKAKADKDVNAGVLAESPT